MKKMNFKLNPWWVTGFTDAEGCFTVTISKDYRQKTKWSVYVIFQIGLHSKDFDLLSQIKTFFNDTGHIYIESNSIRYKIAKLKELNEIVIPHFEKYPLISQKYSDFIIFKEIIELINNKQHLVSEGLIKIISLRAHLNKGLSSKLITSFPDIKKIDRIKPIIPNLLDSNWIAGFFSGESCFFISIRKNNNITLALSIGQNMRDILLINSFVNFFNCGTLYKNFEKNYIEYRVYNFESIYNIIIPLFKKYKIKGIKYKDFLDFCEAAELINKKIHLTSDGFNKIKIIKSRMNKNRC